jgi:hypothetical protein
MLTILMVLHAHHIFGTPCSPHLWYSTLTISLVLHAHHILGYSMLTIFSVLHAHHILGTPCSHQPWYSNASPNLGNPFLAHASLLHYSSPVQRNRHRSSQLPYRIFCCCSTIFCCCSTTAWCWSFQKPICYLQCCIQQRCRTTANNRHETRGYNL